MTCTPEDLARIDGIMDEAFPEAKSKQFTARLLCIFSDRLVVALDAVCDAAEMVAGDEAQPELRVSLGVAMEKILVAIEINESVIALIEPDLGVPAFVERFRPATPEPEEVSA